MTEPLRKCPICGEMSRDIVADHCHASETARELICRSCNAGLGMFKDQPDAIRRAADYVERHTARRRTAPKVKNLKAFTPRTERTHQRRARRILSAPCGFSKVGHWNGFAVYAPTP